MASVSIRNTHKRYGSTEVLKGVSLDIPDGDFTVLVGPSGCGKSTLLRMIAGLEDISQGDIFIGERRVNDLAPRERDIAMVFQNYALYPHMTVRENLSFALRLMKMPEAEMRRRTESAAQILGLDALLDRFPRQLSGGQRQRVAMGRAIVRQPRAFLFDEPLSNLDAKLRVTMRTKIKALHQRLRTTSVYVTHDQVEAMTMADTIVVLHDGRVEQQGAPLQLYDDPANRFVAQFIGSPSMNLLPATVQDQRLLVGQEWVPVPVTGLANGRQVQWGVRPEHWWVDDAHAENGSLSATVRVIEPTGADILVYLDLAGYEVCLLLRERRALHIGQVLHLRPTSSYLFDTDTGQRIR